MTITYKNTLTAQRYSDLLRIAKSALETHKIIRDITKDLSVERTETALSRLENIKFSRSDCCIIALDYSISATEAFINHLGYIFCDDWSSKFEEKNFWNQYEKVKSTLNSLLRDFINNFNMLPTPYIDFENLRNKRNKIHHPHSSKHDYSSEEGCLENDDSDIERSFRMLSETWVSISINEAQLAFDSTNNFIKSIHDSLKKAKYLSQINFNNLSGRKTLLNNFLENPFSRPLVSGSKDYSNK
jgi:hypothetical protein